MSDEKTGSTAGQLAGFLPYQLSVASNAVSSLIAERYRKRFGLRIPEWRIMAVLGDQIAGRAEGGGAMTQRALSAATLMDKVAVNRAARVLDERGLVTRAANARDGRSHLIALTAEGRAVHAEIMPLALATERELLSGLKPGEEALLRDLLARLRSSAGHLTRAATENDVT